MTKKRPFFTRFLENQERDQIRGGHQNFTLKWPSDNDEAGGDDLIHRLRNHLPHKTAGMGG